MRILVTQRLRSRGRSGTIESLLSFFRDRSSNGLSSRRSRHRSTLTPCHCRLVCLLMLSHVLVQQMSMLQTDGVSSQVDTATMGMVATILLVRVVLVQLVLHVLRMRMMVDRMTMMRSDHSLQIQLVAPLCLDYL